MHTPKTPSSITVRAAGMTAVYQGNGQWSIQSRRTGRKTVAHNELLGLLPDHTRPRRAKKGGK
jgi:hypothetical protein